MAFPLTPLLPLAAVVTLSVVYHSDLGLKTVIIYLLLFGLLFFGAPIVGINSYLALSFQAGLAAIMCIHAKAKSF